MRVFLVEDEPKIRKFLSYYLEKFFEVVSFQNGHDALDEIKAGNLPDVVITDSNMPEITGNELLKRIKNNALSAEIPVIILSGNDKSTDRIQSFRLGADDYINKPFNPEEVYYRILNVVKRTQTVDARV